MFKNVILAVLCVGIAASTMLVSGCEKKWQTGTLAGAGAGAAIGQIAGGNTEATLIGAGIGAVAGGVVGAVMDSSDEKKAEEAKKKAATEASANSITTPGAQDNTVTVWLTNGNGSQTPVRLTRNGDGSYTGPKGERYQSMPTEEQLKPVYGI